MNGLVTPTSGVPPGESSAGRLVYTSSKLAVHSSLATTGLKGAGICRRGHSLNHSEPAPVHNLEEAHAPYLAQLQQAPVDALEELVLLHIGTPAVGPAAEPLGLRVRVSGRPTAGVQTRRDTPRRAGGGL